MTELGFALFEGEPKPDEAINLHISNAIARVEGLNNEALRRIDRAFELLKLEEAGRLVVLPCKVGDTVYEVHRWKDGDGFIVVSKMVGLHLFDEKSRRNLTRKEYVVLRCNGYSKHVDLDKLGKTVFLTREEAEKALEGMK